MVAAALLSSLILASPAAAIAGCGGHEMNTGCAHMGKRQVTNEDAVKNCVWYAYPDRDTMVTNKEVPVLWADADILPGDTEAQALFDPIDAELKQKFPNIQPHGSRSSMENVTYDGATDPDCWWTRTRCSTPKSETGLSADVTTLPEPQTWGLGIDDGPNCTNTVLYDFFKSQDPPVKASLYYIGSNVLNWPKEGMHGVNDGHQICVHTWSHPMMTSRTNSQAFAELYYTRKVIQKLLGRTPLCWRPPYGDVDNRIRFIADKLNLTLHLWSDDTFDWSVGMNGVTMANVTQNYENVFNKAKNGTYATHGPIVLNHEVNNNTMSEIINQFPNIKANFKYIVPIATGLNITHPYAEQDLTFPNFATLTGNSDSGNVTNDPTATTGAGANKTGAGSAGSAASSGTTAQKKQGSSASPVVISSGLVLSAAALALLI